MRNALCGSTTNEVMGFVDEFGLIARPFPCLKAVVAAKYPYWHLPWRRATLKLDKHQPRGTSSNLLTSESEETKGVKMAEAGEDAPLLPRDTEESSQRSLSQTSSMAMGEPLMQLESFDGHGSSVIEFCRKHDLEAYITTFQKASTLLQADVVLEELSTITTQELQALRAESEQKWNQPRTLYFAIVMCSLGAVEQGTAQTSMNGANLYFPAQFGIGSNSPRDTMIVGLINSGIYLSVAIM
jgi:hypothetical protein